MMPLLLTTAIPDFIPASIHSVPGGILTLVDAALRALLVACLVGAGLRLLAPRQVPAQKAAWGLVLAGALLMPLLASLAGNATWLPSSATLVVPAQTWSHAIASRVSALLPAEPKLETASAAPASSPLAPPDSEVTTAPPERPATSPSSDGLSFPAPAISNAPSSGNSAPPTRPESYYLAPSDIVWMIYGAVCLALLLRLAYGLGGAIGLCSRPSRSVLSRMSLMASTFAPAAKSPPPSPSDRALCCPTTMTNGISKNCASCWPMSVPMCARATSTSRP